jgi:hypothetical protein
VVQIANEEGVIGALLQIIANGSIEAYVFERVIDVVCS